LSLNREFVLVSEIVHDHYRKRWSEIDREWNVLASIEAIGTVRHVVRAARDELRAEIRHLAKSFPPNESGTYLIPV
jgi:hypothetical protein